jgi:hypothetical protein
MPAPIDLKGTDLVSFTTPRGFRRRLTRRAAAAATALTAATLFLGTPVGASGTTANRTAASKTAAVKEADAVPVKVAIVSPLLSIMSFGATFGLPEVCITGSGAMLTFANAIPGATAAVGGLAGQFSSQCSQMAAQSGVSIAAFNQAIAPLTAINAAANPMIEQGANLVESIGNNYSTSLAPLGPMIVGFGADMRFFEGS